MLWLESVILEGNIKRAAIIEITIYQNPVEINCLSRIIRRRDYHDVAKKI
jgi:hypothetical protein